MNDPRDTVRDLVCRICQEPINRWVDEKGTESWLHGREFSHDYGHAAEPIPRAEATEVQNYCDFCSDPRVAWVYMTREEVQGILAKPTFQKEEERTPLGKDWDRVSNKPGPAEDLSHNVFSRGWAACATCANFIELRDMERLITHVRRALPHITVPRNHFRNMYREFFRLIGERHQFPPATTERTPES